MSDRASGMQLSEKPPAERRLDSWKEIAAYLGRDVTTVQRWEKREGMPIHRHVHDKRGSVYALHSELDSWRAGRNPRAEENNGSPARNTAPPAVAKSESISQAAGPVARRRWVVMILASAVLLAAIGYALWVRSRTVAVAPAPAPEKIGSLAVLPFKNLTGDPGREYLADGLTDALIGRLSGIHDLRVISRTSVMSFKNPRTSVPEIGKTLGVDAIVEGSVMRDGNRIRVTAQLIRAATDEHFWSETYDRQLSDVFSLESDLAQTIAAKVEVTVTGEEQERLAAARSVAPDVYESYSKGEFALNKSHNKAEIDESVGYFKDAIQKIPRLLPRSWAWRMRTVTLERCSSGASPKRRVRKWSAQRGKPSNWTPILLKRTRCWGTCCRNSGIGQTQKQNTSGLWN